MTKAYLFFTVFILASCAVLVVAQSTAATRCFQFTWLGPQYNNDSVFLNATCQEATRLADGVPCVQPLVASFDGSWPDVDYIWTHHREQASCVLSPNDVCAQYTYYFNNIVENSTYMCTRAVDQLGHSITSGCYSSTNGSSTTRVCFCRSVPGGVPCNSSSLSTVVSTLSIFLVLTLFVNRNVINMVSGIILQ